MHQRTSRQALTSNSIENPNYMNSTVSSRGKRQDPKQNKSHM